MGVGRRMGKKQGVPEALSEGHFAKLKRKAGLPVDPVPAPQNKKRKVETKANGNAAKKAKTDVGGKAHVAAAKTAKPNRKAGNKAASNGKAHGGSGGKAGKLPPPPEIGGDTDEDESGSSVERLSDLEDGPLGMDDDFLDSDSEVYDSDQDRHAMFSDDEDFDAEEQLTTANIEGLSRKLDKQREEDEAAAQAELRASALQTNIDEEAPRIFDDNDDGDDDDEAAKRKPLLAPDLQVLRTRITDTIRVLDDFSRLAEEGRSRSEYTAQLLKDVCSYYGYSEFLAQKLLNLFTPREAFAFFEANETPRPVVIRTNTLRTTRRDLAQALINRGVTLEPVGKWSRVGLQIFESSVPLGATPEYLAGHYILQAASSFLPCMALDPQENERVLDMAAAPGGKTTYLAAMMKNTGVVVANDPNKARAKALVGNIHRLGVRNTIVSNLDAREFPKPMGGFDRVLLDAPCSGTGVISKDPSVKTNRTDVDFLRLPHNQKQLLLAAIDSVNHHSSTGGFVVYSTCSVAVEENEQVVQYALRKRPNVRMVDSGLAFGKEGFVNYMGKAFDPSMRLARRYYPHTFNVDGFFLAKLQKTGPTPASAGAGESVGAEHADAGADKTPIAEEDADDQKAQDEFGGFDDEEDREYMEKAQKNAMRRRGLDPKAADRSRAKKLPSR